MVWAAGQMPAIDLSSRPMLQTALTDNRTVVIRRSDVNLSAGERDYLNRVGAELTVIVPVVGSNQTLGAAQIYYVDEPASLPEADVLQRLQHMALEALVTLANQPSKVQGNFHVVEEMNRAANADWCDLSLLTPDKERLYTQVSLGKGVWLKPPQPTFDLSPYPELLEALRGQTPINKQYDGKMMSSGMHALFEATQGRSILGLPLARRGQVHGLILFVDTRRSRVFGQRNVDVARTMVAQAATALDNARLVHDLERSLKELRETQDRLVQTARLSAMGELAAAVAHQINNPLTTIMVDSEMMLLDEPPESRNYRSLQAINRAGKRAAGVARRLLAIARPNNPDSPPQPIDVVDTIEGVLSLVKSHIERDRIQITADLPAVRLPAVWAVQGQLDDIWLNLVMNAHDALMGRDDAEIRIRAEYLADNEVIQVTVADNGPGIPKQLIQEVFKPFFTTKPVGEGTGLGLHICRQTAERVGGSISVKSSPSEGTIFFVRLPVKKGVDL
jgi:signal transduction histidine kinase